FPPAFNGQAIRCFGESNASVNIVGSGGVGSITGVFNFTYTITELPLNNSGFNSGTFTGLPAGTFNATVRDANGCPFAVAPFVITPPTQLQISGSVTSNYFGQQISCFGEDDGIITATASGGVTAYTYELLLAPGGTTVGAPQASTVFNGSIPANTYQIKLTDANGCERTSANIVVSQPTQITATASLVKGIDCFGDNNAIIRITRSGGTVGNAVYTFTNPPTPAPTPPSASTGTTATFFEFTNVSFGTGFGFTVTDINGCTSPISNLIDVLEPPQLVVTAVKRSPYNGGRDISCFGAKDGIVDVTSVGGTGTVEFKFDQDFGNRSGETSGVFTGLDVYPAPGLTFTGKDDNECEATSNPVLLIQPDPISTTAAGSAINNANRGGFDISCFNGNDGTLEVAIPLSGEFGGTPAYTYTLLENPLNNSGQSNGVFTNLRAGNYRVRIIDVNNCSFITPTATIIQPTRLTVTAVKQSPYNGFDVSCDVATDGRLTITTTTGGVPAYSYQLFREGISTPEVIAGNVFNNLATNLSYTVVVTDLNDCTAESLPIILIPPTPLFSGVVFGDKSRCESGNNSDVTNPFLVTPPSGGIGNYTFEWIRLSDNAVVATTATIDPDAFLNFTPGATTPQVVSFIRRVTSSLGPGAPAPCQIADSPEPVTVTVNPLPVADFKLSDPLNDVICPGSTVLLDANFTVGTEPYRFEFTEVRSTTPTPTTTNFNRLGGDNNQLFFSSINENRRWTLTRVEDLNKCVITPNLVAETEVIQISANFTVVTPSPICSGEAYDFQFNANQNILYEWAWPTGLTEAQGPFATNGVQTQTETFVNTSFSSASNLPVTLTATYNDPANPTEVCSVTSTKIVRVKPNLNAQIVVDKPEICSESSVLVNNLSLGVGTHTWTVTDQNGDRPTSPELENGLGASVLNPDPLPTAISSRSYKFETEEGDANPKVYTIQYDIVNTSEGVTCSATTQAVVTVYRKAIADFEFASNPILWSFGVNADAIIINNTSGSTADDIPDTAFEYNWNFDRDATPETSTTTDKTFTVNYAQFGQREVSLTVLNPNAPISLERCQTSIRKVLVINVAPIFADFNLTPINSCLPTTLEVNYDDILQPAGTSFTWELFFIDNITGLPSRIAESSEFKPAFSVSKAGAYRLELVVRNSIT
ncbi:MAG: SprB repeat-containing protein, partial [Chryseotalea sp.]